mgnify:CR=1 FL=1
MKVWLDGVFRPEEEVRVSPLSHSFSRGSAIFEVLEVIDSKKGPGLFGLHEHLDRFFRTAELVKMDIPVSRETLVEAVIATTRENNVKRGVCKFFAYYPSQELGLIPRDWRVSIAVYCMDYENLGFSPEEFYGPARVGISTYKKLHPDTVPVHAKVTGNYVNAFLAEREVIDSGFDDVVMVDTDGYIAEGATANVFFVKDGEVLTPRLRNIMTGITRMAVLEILASLEIPCRELDIYPEDVAWFDEAFYSGSINSIQPIRSVDDIELKGKCPGPVTEKVQDMFRSICKGEVSIFEKWVTVV